MTDDRQTPSPAQRRFRTTRWSVIREVGHGDAAARHAALEELCASYWYPLYAFLRRRGEKPEEAADLTQGFFADLLARDDLARVVPEGGRFRSWLLSALQHFASRERERGRALKRGGGRKGISIESADAEARDEKSPESLFERRWALTVIERALARLRGEYDERGRAEWFDALKGGLTGEGSALSTTELAENLGTTGGAPHAFALPGVARSRDHRDPRRGRGRARRAARADRGPFGGLSARLTKATLRPRRRSPSAPTPGAARCNGSPPKRDRWRGSS